MAATHIIRRSGSLLSSLSSSRFPLSLIHRLRPLVGGLSAVDGRLSPSTAACCSVTHKRSFSHTVRDSVPKNPPPTVPPGCDFNHWFVLMERPRDTESRAEIIDTYIETLALVVGSKEEARAKIYSISTCCSYSFGALVSEELAAKILTLPKVLQVFPDCYLDVPNKDYGCEPFIDGQALPNQQCNYHEKWKSNALRGCRFDPNHEGILPPGCDNFHWFVYMKRPEGNPSRPEIIDSYIKTLASVLGSEEEAKIKIYSISTSCYYSFSALVPEEVALKIEELPQVRCVLPDSYVDPRKKIYGGEPFINGEALPYNRKYHAKWIMNRGDLDNDSVRPVVKYCVNCGKPGHYARDCPVRR